MKYTLESALAKLRRAHGVVVQGKAIAVTPGMVGIGTYGVIDYLVNIHHFRLVYNA